jgi:phosphoribosylamine--glycine ligase
MNVLLVGSGGREHALAWKLRQSPLLTRLVAAPGNPGIADIAELADIKVTDVAGLVALAREIAADLVVVGPEAALEAGIADAMAEAGIPCFGPTRAAARLETSKGFTKAFALRHDIPTAEYGEFTDAAEAKAALDRFSPPYVIKADGIAAGKGVVIAETRAAAEQAIDDMLGGQFGAAGARLVIEAFMTGEEASVFALCDGRTARLFGAAQDHKRVGDGDTGPNTGGMGAYSPAPVMTPERMAFVERRMVEATVAGMAAEGAPYVGVLYAGVMVTDEGPKLVEYNARFGDPECQVLMLRLAGDLLPYLLACARGQLAEMPPIEWRDETALCVVMAAPGYPEAPVTGSRIRGTDADFGPAVTVFHAGTRSTADGALVSAGGRVLNVCARDRDVAEARRLAYAAVDAIDWPEGFCRRDIAWRALSR